MTAPTPALRVVRKALLLSDLSGHARASLAHDDVEMASFLHDYYCVCERVVTDAGGRVVKFMGDACLATFPEERAADAVAAAVRIGRETDAIARSRGFDMKAGANLHLSEFVEGEVGAGGSRRVDVLGRGVNQVFLVGRGPGVRLTEPMYRRLPSGERTPWRRYKPPAVYRLEPAGAAGPMGASGPGGVRG